MHTQIIKCLAEDKYHCTVRQGFCNSLVLSLSCQPQPGVSPLVDRPRLNFSVCLQLGSLSEGQVLLLQIVATPRSRDGTVLCVSLCMIYGMKSFRLPRQTQDKLSVVRRVLSDIHCDMEALIVSDGVIGPHLFRNSAVNKCG